ncbi:MAG TPA: YCF48-related protein [Ignavibacteriaceae bacterium]|nr:YCF48-related protein [Ignavibacteriaceae bacterium]
MKTIAKTFVLFLLTANLFAQTSYNYTDIFFLDENHGWILGTNGNLWKTTNTSITWEHIYNNDISGGIGLQFTSPTTGWITKHSELFTTSDGGYTWRVVFNNPYIMNYSNSYFINDSIGFISSDTALFRTTDSGEDWEAIEDTLGSFIRTYFYDENLGFLKYYEYIGVGNSAYVYKTTDLGNTWMLSRECGSMEGCGYGPIQMLNENEGYMGYHWVAAFPVTSILKTKNGGIHGKVI